MAEPNVTGEGAPARGLKGLPRPWFHAGDVVMLRSGGPFMTVCGALSDGRFNVRWFEGEVARKGTLPHACLLSETEYLIERGLILVHND